jgi:hypothetical protein
MTKAPREGSRKAEVYAVFHDKGLEAAVKHAVSLGLKAGTVNRGQGVGQARQSRPLPRYAQGTARPP